MISTDEYFKNEEVRIYTRVHTKGHWKQESFFALPDNSHGGLLKSEFEERGGNLETGEANGNYGSEIGIGHTIYYHVNCEPHEPFLMKLALWDDDSLWLSDVKKAVKDILGLSGLPQEVKLWGGAGLAIAGLVEKALASSKDNWSELELGPKDLTGTVTLQTKLRTESYDWKLGDPGADFLLTIKKITTEQSCGFDGWRTIMNEFTAQLELEKTLRDKLHESYGELLDKVQKEAEESRRPEQERKSPRETSERTSSLEDALRDDRLAVEAVLDEVREEWRGPDGTLPQERWNDLERLAYWADDTENLSPDRLARKTARAAAPDDPLAPIEVGPRDEVGKKSLGEKAAERVVGGVLGQILGGGSRGSSRTDGPRTRRDPTRRQDYVELDKPEPGITVGARSRWTDDGLLVSTRISDHDEKGTYHSVYLQSCDGRRLYPRRLEIYDLWAEHSLTVSWTRTTYVDGQVVNRESGGWSDAWSEFLGRHTVDEAELPGIWQMYGYDRAHSGIQQLGAYFNLNPEQLAELGDLALITHITRPEQDPVITEPFNWLLSGDAEQPRLHDPSAPIHQVTDAPSHWQQWLEDCDKATKPGTELTQTESAGTVVERAAEDWDLGTLEAGKTYPTTVSVSNRCEGIRKFRVENETPWLRLEKSDYVVGPGEEVAADAIVDTKGLGECEYAAEVTIQCLDCPPTCHQKKERITARAKIEGKYRDPCAERYEKCLSNIMRWDELAEAQCRVENEMESLLKDNPDCMERMNAACSEVRRQYSELEEKSERLGSEMEESDAKWKECKSTGASWSAEAEYGEETVERSGEGLDCHPRGMVSVSYLVSTHLLVPILSHPPPPYTFEDIGTVPPGGKVRIIGPPVNGFYPVDLTCPEDKSGYNLETDAKVGWISKVHTTIYKDGDDEFTGVGPRSGGSGGPGEPSGCKG